MILYLLFYIKHLFESSLHSLRLIQVKSYAIELVCEMAHNIYSMEVISAEIRQFLKEKHSEAEITDFINNLEPKAVKPTLKLHQLNPETITEPTLVYAHLMVQDIRDVYYYISFAIRKKYSPN